MIFIIEGNIGAGKSTLLDPIKYFLASYRGLANVAVISEPVEDWCRHDLLKRFYSDKTKHGLQLQLAAIMSYFENERLAVKLSREGKCVVLDRSLYSSQRVFGDLLVRQFSDEDEDLFNMICKRFPPVIGGKNGYQEYVRIYVNTPVDECMRRIATRGRNGEQNITSEYLTDIETISKRVILDDEFESRKCVVLDGCYQKGKPMSAQIVPNENESLTVSKRTLGEYLLMAMEGNN